MTSNSKTYTLRSSGSLNKILATQKGSLQRNVISKLYLAKKKLHPVISDFMKTAKENGSKKPFQLNKPYYLTVDQYKDAVWASHFLKEVDEMLRQNKSRSTFSKSLKIDRFTLDHANVKVNRCGKICVDTSILVQIMELHKMMGEVIDYLQEMPLEPPTGTQTETDESSNHGKDDDSTKQSRLEDILNDLDGSSNVTDKTEKLTKEILTALTLPLNNDFFVMAAQSSDTRENLATLPEETTSNSEVNLTDDTNRATRQTKSTSSFLDDEKSQVTDAAGARRIIVRCMSDLDKVRHYLERDYVAGISSVGGLDADEDILDERDKEERRKSRVDRQRLSSVVLPKDREEYRDDQGEYTEDREDLHRDRDHRDHREDERRDHEEERREHEEERRDHEAGKPHEHDESAVHDHDRKPDHISREPSRHSRPEPSRQSRIDSDDDKRKCCCAEDCPADQPLEFTWQEDAETSSKLIICIKGKSEEEGDVHIVIKQCPECKLYGGTSSSGPGMLPEHRDSTPPPQAHRDHSLHPQDRPPSPHSEDTIRDTHHGERMSRAQSIKPKTHNFESAILHGKDPDDACDVSSTEDMDGSDNINVIFNPNDPSSSVVEGIRKKAMKKKKVSHAVDEKMSTIKLNETINLNLQTDQGPELIISLTVRPKIKVPVLDLKEIFSESQTDVPERDGDQPEKDEAPKEEEEEEDLGIPLSRTKVCSSLEFDVQTVKSRMKSSGIRHKNPEITFRLNDLGVNNLLRASRPVKCGRKAILNETMMKCLPYAPSLKSLPLEDADTDIIDQSLNMSMTKSKHSTIFLKESKLSHTGGRKSTSNEMHHTKQIYFVHVPAPDVYMKVPRKKYSRVEQLLGFYINLENDVYQFAGSHVFEVRYFEIENIRKNICTETDPPDTVFSVRLRNNRRSNIVTGDIKSKVDGSVAKIQTGIRSGSSYGRFPSRIPIYKTRKSERNKIRSNGALDIYDVSLVSLPKKGKNGKGFAVEFKSLIDSEKQKNINSPDRSDQTKPDILLKQAKNKSLLTLKNVSRTNTIEIFPPNDFASVESFEYFNSFLRNAAAFQNSKMAHDRRKKKEFYSSRSHCLLVSYASKEKDQSGDENSTRGNNGSGKKCIKHNNVDLSSTQFKKQLDSGKNVSKMLINDLSTFIYENFVKDLSAEAKIEIFRKIDSFLKLNSRIKLKQNANKSSNEKGKSC